MTATRISTDQRFAQATGSPDDCWPWGGSVDGSGYGRSKVAGHTVGIHRTAYVRAHGPIPPGRVVDHTCHSRDTTCRGGRTCPHRRCVNPAHMELVTGAENTLRGRNRAAENARKTHCKRGHPLSGANVYVWHRMRRCRICRLDGQRRRNS